MINSEVMASAILTHEEPSSSERSSDDEMVTLSDFLKTFERDHVALFDAESLECAEARIVEISKIFEMDITTFIVECRGIFRKVVDHIISRRAERVRQHALVRSANSRILVSMFSRDMQAKNAATDQMMIDQEDPFAFNSDAASLATNMYACELEETDSKKFEQDLLAATDTTDLIRMVEEGLTKFELLKNTTETMTTFGSLILALRQDE